jgi:hypothetical protein
MPPGRIRASSWHYSGLWPPGTNPIRRASCQVAQSGHSRFRTKPPATEDGGGMAAVHAAALSHPARGCPGLPHRRSTTDGPQGACRTGMNGRIRAPAPPIRCDEDFSHSANQNSVQPQAPGSPQTTVRLGQNPSRLRFGMACDRPLLRRLRKGRRQPTPNHRLKGLNLAPESTCSPPTPVGFRTTHAHKLETGPSKSVPFTPKTPRRARFLKGLFR